MPLTNRMYLNLTVNNQTGFTLFELIVTITIAGIVMGLAIPSFNEAIKNNRLTTQANDFVTALSVARSEAVKRGQRVSICESADGTTCVAGGAWTQGWIVFNNPDDDAVVDAPGETVIRAQGAAQSQMRMVTPNAGLASRFSYLSSGTISATGSIRICDERPGAKRGRAIVFGTTGRADTVNCAGSEYYALDVSNANFPAQCKDSNSC